MTDSPPPTAALTAPVKTGWRARLDLTPNVQRLRLSAIAIVQIVVAASAAWAFSYEVLRHPAPVLAATVTVSSLGLVRDARPKRVLTTIVGMLIGVLIADGFSMVAGTGWWQMAIVLAVTLLVARFLSAYPPFAILAAIQGIVVMSTPSISPFSRLVDGVVGGVAALVATALIPRNPRREELRDGQALFNAYGNTVGTIVQALRRGDRNRATRALEKARGLGPLVDDWKDALDSALGVAGFSPWLRRQRPELQRHENVRQAMDFVVRGTRLVARNVVYVCEDGVPRPVSAAIVRDIMRGAELIGQSLADISVQPAAQEVLLSVASRLDPATLMPDASLGDHQVIAGMRPIVVDLLTATGMSAADARAALPHI
jgi:hypothetical protein